MQTRTWRCGLSRNCLFVYCDSETRKRVLRVLWFCHGPSFGSDVTPSVLHATFGTDALSRRHLVVFRSTLLLRYVFSWMRSRKSAYGLLDGLPNEVFLFISYLTGFRRNITGIFLPTVYLLWVCTLSDAKMAIQWTRTYRTGVRTLFEHDYVENCGISYWLWTVVCLPLETFCGDLSIDGFFRPPTVFFVLEIVSSEKYPRRGGMPEGCTAIDVEIIVCILVNGRDPSSPQTIASRSTIGQLSFPPSTRDFEIFRRLLHAELSGYFSMAPRHNISRTTMFAAG